MAKRVREEAEPETLMSGALPVSPQKKQKSLEPASDSQISSSDKKKSKKNKSPKVEESVQAIDEDARLAEDKAAKKERKRLKALAKEEQSKQSNGHASAEESSAKESKEERRARKAAKRAAKADAIATPSTIAPSNGHSDAAQGGYIEHTDLATLPQSKVDRYLEEQMVHVDAESPLRPILDFTYLPTDSPGRGLFKGFKSPTPIQAVAWPYLLAGRDAVGVAQTGSGKTLAFGVPCMRYVTACMSSSSKPKRLPVKAVVVSPTRELAQQIHEQYVKLAEGTGVRVVCIFGGMPKDPQREELKKAQIVIATPGRLNDFIGEGSADLSNVGYLVLDEADRMLEKGFEEDMRKIIGATPDRDRQTLMFTATWPPAVREIASKFMKKPVKITIGDNPTGELRANTKIKQEVEVIDPRAKERRLIELLKQHQTGKKKNDRVLVFCLYKKEASRVEQMIRSRGFNVAGIHGDMNQTQRMKSLEGFKVGEVPLLVATDVAARGLDIPAVKVVINMTFPLTVEDYVHRIGRTGRAGADGLAVTLFTEHDKAQSGGLINVLKAANQPVPEELMKFGTTVKKKAHDMYGAFFKDTSDMKQATKITFD